MKNLLSILLLSIAGIVVGCEPSDPNKAAEKRILDDVNRLAETSGRRMRSEEFRSSMIRLNELGKGFPEQRHNIEREGEIIKGFLAQMINDELNIAKKWNELVQLPISDKYRKCLTAQARNNDLTVKQFSALADEINVFLDLSVKDKVTLDTKLEPILSRKEELEIEKSDNQIIVDRECGRPRSNTSDQ